MYHFATQELEQAYRNAITTNNRPFNTVEGVITFPDNRTPLVVNSSNLPTDAIKISKQCTDGEELMFGGVFTSELEMSLLTDLDRYAFFGATIELTFRIHIGTENNEPVFADVPLGVFTVADADRPKGIVNIKAYDNMTLLDKSIGENIISGSIWEILQRIQTDTGYQLGFNQNYLNNFVNTEVGYALEASADHGIKTYRDVLKMLCQLMGCFGLDDRMGNLTLKKFSTTADLTLGDNTTRRYPWYTLVPADYVSKYIGISITALNGTYQTVSPDPTEQGLIMTIDDAPAWDLGTQASLQERTSELFTYLHGIVYTPCELDMSSDATIDCGDMIALNVRGESEPINTIVTSLEWKFHKGMTITSEGANPLIEESIVESGSQRILNQAVANSKLQFIHFTNPSEISIGDTDDIKIAEVEFTPTTDTDAMFVATILVDADVDDIVVTDTEEVEVPVKAYYNGEETQIKDKDGNIVSLSGIANNTTEYRRDGKCSATLYYKMNDVKLPNDTYPYYAIEELENGQHIITVAYPLAGLVGWQRYEFEVHLICNGGSMTIAENAIKASIFGQQIDLVNRFSGVIKVEEDIELAMLYGLGIVEATDEGEIILHYTHFIRVSDNLLLYNISDVNLMSIYEGTGELAPHIYLEGGAKIITDDEKYIITDDGRRIITD